MAQNPLYNLLGGQASVPANMKGILNQFQQFKNSFSGDPKQTVQQLLNSGRISQAQYDQAVQMANQLQNMLNKS